MIGVSAAAKIAQQSNAHLTICLVNIAHGGARGPTINHWNEDEAAKILDDAETAAKSTGHDDVGTTELISRETASAIVTYADQNGYDHIVMGTGDKRGVKRLVLGSVASEVASHAHCTVTIAR
jgi:nucleotide-binding universal stress UspA family protein